VYAAAADDDGDSFAKAGGVVPARLGY